jgi:hypothetical protein
LTASNQFHKPLRIFHHRFVVEEHIGRFCGRVVFEFLQDFLGCSEASVSSVMGRIDFLFKKEIFFNFLAHCCEYSKPGLETPAFMTMD